MFVKRFVADEFIELLRDRPVVALIGPRQVGKTTLARALAGQLKKSFIYLDLESDEDARKISEPEFYFTERQDRLIILDEIQRLPSLFPILRSVVDRHRTPGRFLLLGSASPTLLQHSSESLAGRIAYLELQPFTLSEISKYVPYQRHWLRGGYPEIVLAPSDRTARRRTFDFINSYIERELPSLGLPGSPARIRTLLFMLVGIHGGLLNTADLSRSLGVSVPTVAIFLNYLENSFVIRMLKPFYLNISKRLVKAPKVYIRDSGIFHSLSGIDDLESLTSSLYLGRSWEGYVVQEVIAHLSYDTFPFFYRTADGAELDLLLVKGNPVVGIEIKYTNAPVLTKGTYNAVKDLEDIPLLVVTPSAEDYLIREKVQVCSLSTVMEHLRKLHVLSN